MTTETFPVKCWSRECVLESDCGEVMWFPQEYAPTLRDAVARVMAWTSLGKSERRDLIRSAQRVHMHLVTDPDEREEILRRSGVDITSGEPYWRECDAGDAGAFPVWRFG